MMRNGQVAIGLLAVIHGLNRKKDTKTQVCASGSGSLVRVGSGFAMSWQDISVPGSDSDSIYFMF
jgi:hypothetical protein